MRSPRRRRTRIRTSCASSRQDYMPRRSSCMMAPPVQNLMHIRRPPPLLLAMTLALSVAAIAHAADDFVLTRFSDYLDALRIQAGIPGMAAAIVGPTEVSWEGVFGRQDLERNLSTLP